MTDNHSWSTNSLRYSDIMPENICFTATVTSFLTLSTIFAIERGKRKRIIHIQYPIVDIVRVNVIAGAIEG